jgi:NADPH:quinone reductase-like Zn-dependent oxidoreductase
MPMMRSASAKAGAGIQSLSFHDVTVPAPGPGEVLVELRTATINFRDLLVLRGILPGAKEPEYVPLSDAAGVAVSVGGDVERIKLGDRVNPIFAQGWLTGPIPTGAMLGGPVDGVARQFAVFDAQGLCVIPDQLGDLEAATLPCAGLTAWNALFGPRPVQPGDWVLLQGTGGVSLAALQWAKAAGANVVITSSSDAKLRRAQSLGADIAINYRTTADWAAAARDAVGANGVDIVVDVVGESQLDACARTLGENGVIAAVGQLMGAASWGKDVGKPVFPIAIGNRDQHDAMLAFCVRHAIRPVVDAVYDLPRLSDALRLMESGSAFGKIAINLA